MLCACLHRLWALLDTGGDTVRMLGEAVQVQLLRCGDRAAK